MNTYNDNLYTTVVSILQAQAMVQKNLLAQLTAAEFTLYYAQGAQITADEKLNAAMTDLAFKTEVKKQAVHSTNIANKLLASATRADQYCRQGVTNMATCAANVQVAANAIVRLAGDVGSIFSIVNAADSGTEVYNNAATIRDLINDTAHSAELAAQMAMECSASTSEVSSATVLDNAKAANGFMNNLLKITSVDNDGATQAVADATAVMETAATATKLAEGSAENIGIDLGAANIAYANMNKQLNLNLQVNNITEKAFTINFDLIKNPFDHDAKKKNRQLVKNYYAILVKENKKETFSITNAENLFLNPDNHEQLILLPLLSKKSATNTKWDRSCVVNYFEMSTGAGSSTYILKDSDGDHVTYGQNYTVFLMAEYTDDYKKEINNFSDYLSAPSNTFSLNITWPAVTGLNISATVVSGYTHQIKITSPAKPFVSNFPKIEMDPEYRCIILPAETYLPEAMLTESYLKTLAAASTDQLEKNKQGSLKAKKEGAPNFYFNLALAQQVPAGNYIKAVKEAGDSKAAECYTAFIGPATTDNFGNLLVKGKSYYVVVLTTSGENIVHPEMFTDSLSEITETNKFQYL